jgi:hypothetical protein
MPFYENYINEFKKLKNESLKVKLSHILTYYWIPIAIILFVLFFLVSMIVHYATRKDAALSIHCINAVYQTQASDQFLSNAEQELGIDSSTSEIAFANSPLTRDDVYTQVTIHQQIAAKLTSHSMDFLVSDVLFLLQYAYNGAFCDIRTVLSPEQAEALSPYFLYMDQALADKFATAEEATPEIPDPTAPEKMEAPIPIALQIPKDSAFDKLYYSHTENTIAIAVIKNPPHMAKAAQFLSLLYE